MMMYFNLSPIFKNKEIAFHILQHEKVPCNLYSVLMMPASNYPL